ncbi:hypothetical protein COCVIDRAFT_11078 [Bipolaris victoriae FI3]|uniref:Uncharacterized protein n=1 Tax=Bipolaris victoriae (strain FI3) TaxID=930091 RepID=W7ERX9_BIPV3|nr:hypothetical protein COCVIDRAFT_11078 [Bipolaris victoriae FI3]
MLVSVVALDFRTKVIRRLAFESSYAPRKSAIAGLVILSDLGFALGNGGLAIEFTNAALRMIQGTSFNNLALITPEPMQRLGVDNWTCTTKASVFLAHESQGNFHRTPSVSSYDRLGALNFTEISDEATLGVSMRRIASLANVAIDSTNIKEEHDANLVHWHLSDTVPPGKKDITCRPRNERIGSASHKTCVEHFIQIVEILNSVFHKLRSVQPFTPTIHYIAVSMHVLLDKFRSFSWDDGESYVIAAHLKSLQTILARLAPKFVPAQLLQSSLSALMTEALVTASISTKNYSINRSQLACLPVLALDTGKGETGFFGGSTTESNDPSILRLAALHSPELTGRTF